MTKTTGRIGKALFSMAVAASLGMGASQAFASPAEGTAAASAPYHCPSLCMAQGASDGVMIGGSCYCF